MNLLVWALLVAAPAPVTTTATSAVKSPVDAHAAVDRSKITIGDTVTYSVEASYDPAGTVQITLPDKDFEGLAIGESTHTSQQKSNGRAALRATMKLRAAEVGSYVIAPATVTYTPLPQAGSAPSTAQSVTVQSDRVFVEVVSVLPADGSAQDIHDIKPLAWIWTGLSWRLVLALLAGLAAIFAGLYLFLRRRKQRPVIVASEPPHVLALAALAALGEVDPADAREVRRWHFRISEIIRLYVEQRFGLNATDLTTEEILALANADTYFDGATKQLLRDFLVATDIVKFASYRPVATQIQQVLAAARAFVASTVPQVAPKLAHIPSAVQQPAPSAPQRDHP